MFLVTVHSDEISEEEYNTLKVQLAHTVYGDLTEADIRNMMEKTLQQRRLWIKEDNPPAAAVLKEFPRLLDTPGLVCICVYDWNLFMFVILKILCIIILRSFYSTPELYIMRSPVDLVLASRYIHHLIHHMLALAS